MEEEQVGDEAPEAVFDDGVAAAAVVKEEEGAAAPPGRPHLGAVFAERPHRAPSAEGDGDGALGMEVAAFVKEEPAARGRRSDHRRASVAGDDGGVADGDERLGVGGGEGVRRDEAPAAVDDRTAAPVEGGPHRAPVADDDGGGADGGERGVPDGAPVAAVEDGAPAAVVVGRAVDPIVGRAIEGAARSVRPGADGGGPGAVAGPASSPRGPPGAERDGAGGNPGTDDGAEEVDVASSREAEAAGTEGADHRDGAGVPQH